MKAFFQSTQKVTSSQAEEANDSQEAAISSHFCGRACQYVVSLFQQLFILVADSPTESHCFLSHKATDIHAAGHC